LAAGDEVWWRVHLGHHAAFGDVAQESSAVGRQPVAWNKRHVAIDHLVIDGLLASVVGRRPRVGHCGGRRDENGDRAHGRCQSQPV